jgi:SAM-dependent methyltransferase
MRDDVKAFLDLCVHVFAPAGPVLEIGALQGPGQEGYADLRPLFPGRAYTGCDLVAGPGVDRIENAEALGLPDASVGTVVAADSLEHVRDPGRAIREMHRVLRDDGLCLITTPFVFPIHYPPDYWRFTPEGLATLLAPFPAVAVFAYGCAQWPHTVCGVAARSARASFADQTQRLRHAWAAAAHVDPLVPFLPLASAGRHDTGDVVLDALAGDRVLTQVFECAADGLCRVCIKLDVDGAPGARDLEVTLADAAADTVVRARATLRAHGPVRARWMAFDFDPLPDTAGRRLVLRLTSPAGAADTRVVPHVARDGTLSYEAFVRRAR